MFWCCCGEDNQPTVITAISSTAEGVSYYESGNLRDNVEIAASAWRHELIGSPDNLSDFLRAAIQLKYQSRLGDGRFFLGYEIFHNSEALGILPARRHAHCYYWTQSELVTSVPQGTQIVSAQLNIEPLDTQVPVSVDTPVVVHVSTKTGAIIGGQQFGRPYNQQTEYGGTLTGPVSWLPYHSTAVSGVITAVGVSVDLTEIVQGLIDSPSWGGYVRTLIRTVRPSTRFIVGNGTTGLDDSAWISNQGYGALPETRQRVVITI